MNKTVFLDRDGVINELVYYPEHGIIDSPATPAQFILRADVPEAINRFHELGYMVVVVSNQPGIAKEHFTRITFDDIKEKMQSELKKSGAFIDREYYCLHHPEAKVPDLRMNCDCRKPEPGMLLQAIEEMDIDVSQSWMVGDGLTDIRAGKSAGVRTVLLGRMKCELCDLMDEMDARPDIVCSNLLQVANMIENTITNGVHHET